MIKLNYANYKDKVYACWLGKNIGGTLGGPYEGTREKLNVTGFSSPKGEPLPNDDLDLQLIWFVAIRREGAKNFSAEKLGDYWLTYQMGDPNEYGIAKNNMHLGLFPHVCGDYNNEWKHSNGAWIRTEVWACLAPACPEVAVRYACEDARVDHGTGEGTFAAMFVAAMESCAFAVGDLRKLINIALARIPQNCRTAQTVRLVCDCFDEGKSADETRQLILQQNADIGDGWFQAPSNVGFVVLGLLYGNGDFKKSVLYAVNCGDDTDCTAGTVGAIMGLLYGTKGIPDDWKEYVGDRIVTAFINTTGCPWLFPKTCTEFTEQIVDFAPAVLIENYTDVRITDGEDKIPDDVCDTFAEVKPIFHYWHDEIISQRIVAETPNAFSVRMSSITTVVSYPNGVELIDGKCVVNFKFVNNVKAHGNTARNVKVNCISIPQGFVVDKPSFVVNVPAWTPTNDSWDSQTVSVTITATDTPSAVNKFVFEFSQDCRYLNGYAPVVVINK